VGIRAVGRRADDILARIATSGLAARSGTSVTPNGAPNGSDRTPFYQTLWRLGPL